MARLLWSFKQKSEMGGLEKSYGIGYKSVERSKRESRTTGYWISFQ